jgi:mono/diheme cytochrome c family protein
MTAMRPFCISLGVVLSALCVVSRADGPVVNVDRPLTMEEARALKNPIPFASESISKGRTAYLEYACATCHGDDGKAMVLLVGKPTDLTNPKVWVKGTSDGEIFRSIRDGVSAMPAFGKEIGDTEKTWNLVNFIRSLWPADAQGK